MKDGIIGTTIHQLKSERNVSRNVGDRPFTKIRRVFWCMVYLLRGLTMAIRSTTREQLGSEVIWKGERWQICNWAGSEFPTLSREGGYEKHVPRSEIKNVISFSELLHRMRNHYRWYVFSWHGIDVNKRLYPEAFKRAADQ